MGGGYSPLATPGYATVCTPLSYFNIASKLQRSFALMHLEFESNLITNMFRKFGVSRTTGSDVIFALLSFSFDRNACLSVRVFYSLYCLFITDANL